MPLSRVGACQQQTEVRPLQVLATCEVSARLPWSVPCGSQRPLRLEKTSSNGCPPRSLEMRAAKSEGHVFRSCSSFLTQALPQLSVFQPVSSVCYLFVFPAFPDDPACCGFLQHPWVNREVVIAPQTSSFAWSLCCSFSLRRQSLLTRVCARSQLWNLPCSPHWPPTSHQRTGIRGVCLHAQLMTPHHEADLRFHRFGFLHQMAHSILYLRRKFIAARILGPLGYCSPKGS